MEKNIIQLSELINSGQHKVSLGHDLILMDIPQSKERYAFPLKVDSPICLVVSQGKLQCVVDITSHNIETTGMLIILEGQIVEEMNFSNDFMGWVMIMSSDFLNRLDLGNTFSLMKDTLSRCFYPLSTEQMQSLNNYYSMINGVLQSDNPYKDKVLKHLTLAYLYGFGAYIHTSVSDMPKNRLEEITNQFLTLVRDNCKQHRDIPFYADTLKISSKHLSKAVSTTTGEKAMLWIERYTILNAKHLLRTTSYSISQIADCLSFDNQSDFGKYFKKSVGCSPSEFRKRGF